MGKNRPVTVFLASIMSLWTGLAVAEPPEPKPKAAHPPMAESRLMEQYSAPEGEGESLAGRGVVVRSVGKGSALEKAGLQPGDIIYRWRRLPNPPANPDEANGQFKSPSDWWWVEIEQAQRGRLILSGERSGEGLTLVVESGEWNAVVRPQLHQHNLNLYSRISEALLQGSTSKALSLWSALERKSTEFSANMERAWLYRWFAGELWQRGLTQKSLSLINEALRTEKDQGTRAALLETSGDILEQQGAPGKAEEAFLEALRARTSALGPSLGEAAVHSRLGTFYLYQGRLDKAEQHYRTSLDIRGRLAPGSMDFAASVNNLGVLALEAQDFESALKYFNEALDLRGTLAPGSSVEGESLYNVGLVYASRDEENSSEQFFRRALKLFDAVDPKSLKVAMTLNCLGVIYLDRQDLELARFYFDQALDVLNVVAPESLDVADTLTNLGQISYQEHNLGEAERRFGEALRIQRKIAPEGRAIANNFNNLGMTLGERGAFTRSLEAHREALRVLERIAPEGVEVANNLYNIGVLYVERKNYSKGREFLNQSLALRERLLPDSHILAETYGTLGKMARDMGNLSAAEAWYAKAMEIFERQILFLGSARVGTVPLQTSREEIYRGALSVATKKGDAKAILELLERHRGIQLAEMLSHREDTVLGRLPDDISAELRDLQTKYEKISMDLEALTGKDVKQKSGALISQLSEIQRRYSEAIESARGGSGGVLTFRYPRNFKVTDLTSLMLDQDQGLLYFFIVDEEVWSLLVLDEIRLDLRRHSLSAKDLQGKVERLRSLTQSVRKTIAIEVSEKAARERLSKELYNVLIGPVEASLLPLARLLILPDGPLHLLPWGSLIRDDPNSEGVVHYLAEWKPLHLVLSGSVYSELQKVRPRPHESIAGLTFVAFADPKYSLEDMETLQEALEPGPPSMSRHHPDWQRLLFSRQEVEGIARIFPSDRSQVFFGVEATEERAKSIDESARIIHFATHAHLDDRFPLNSALVLSMPQGLPENRENGLLQVWEIFERIRWHADLVVLSGCETALGQEQGGEGLLGLTRAFQYAGARSVLASLWSVNDQATSELMIRFYKHLLAGLPKDQALQAAQQELLRGPIKVTNEKGERETRDFSAPYYWAGFQLFGDWQ
jgi:CHAT domain-containing protein/Tfp pilus assembly protein PilF